MRSRMCKKNATMAILSSARNIYFFLEEEEELFNDGPISRGSGGVEEV